MKMIMSRSSIGKQLYADSGLCSQGSNPENVEIVINSIMSTFLNGDCEG